MDPIESEENILPCPGSIRVGGRKRWYILEGCHPSDQTICRSCYKEFIEPSINKTGLLFYSIGPNYKCSCDYDRTKTLEENIQKFESQKYSAIQRNIAFTLKQSTNRLPYLGPTQIGNKIVHCFKLENPTEECVISITGLNNNSFRVGVVGPDFQKLADGLAMVMQNIVPMQIFGDKDLAFGKYYSSPHLDLLGLSTMSNDNIYNKAFNSGELRNSQDYYKLLYFVGLFSGNNENNDDDDDHTGSGMTLDQMRAQIFKLHKEIYGKEKICKKALAVGSITTAQYEAFEKAFRQEVQKLKNLEFYVGQMVRIINIFPDKSNDESKKLSDSDQVPDKILDEKEEQNLAALEKLKEKSDNCIWINFAVQYENFTVLLNEEETKLLTHYEANGINSMAEKLLVSELLYKSGKFEQIFIRLQL